MIICDAREPNSVKQQFRIVQRLQKGDFLIVVEEKRLIVERKTVSDLWNSLKSGRLNIQLDGTDLLVVEYNFIPRKIDWEKLYDAISGVALHHPVILTRNVLHTKKVMDRIEQKLRDGTLGVMRTCQVDRTYEDPRIGTLTPYPGIGPERAKKILEHFRTVENALKNMEHWNQVPGIGSKTVKAVLDFVRTTYGIPLQQ